MPRGAAEPSPAAPGTEAVCVSASGAERPFCQPEGAEGWPEPRAWGNYLCRFAQVSTLGYRDMDIF